MTRQTPKPERTVCIRISQEYHRTTPKRLSNWHPKYLQKCKRTTRLFERLTCKAPDPLHTTRQLNFPHCTKTDYLKWVREGDLWTH